MRGRSSAGGEPEKKRRRKSVTLKRRNAPKVTRRRSSSAAREETKVARLTRERDEALQQQRPAADENARLLNELRVSSQQQTATADVLKLISRSTFELQTVLDTLLESAARLCEARRGVMFRREADSYRAVAFYNASPEMIDFVNRHPIKPGRHTITARVALERRTIHVADLQADPEYNYVRRDIDPIRTELGVPMFRGNDIVGVIILYKLVVQPFTDKQIELVTTFADQAVIAIENVRLFEAEQQRTRELAESLKQQTATSEVLQVISRSAFDLEAVLNTLVESASRVCEAERGVIIRPTGEGASYHSAASYGHTPEYDKYIKTLTFTPGRDTVTGRVLLAGKSVQIADVLADAEWAHAHPGAATLGNFRTMLGAPLLREGTPIGIFLLQRAQVRPFTEKQIKLVETFADQAVIAIENTRLFEAEQQRTRELTESLEQQTATAKVLQVISRSTFDLQAVLNTLTESAARLCAADRGAVMQRDGEVYRIGSNYGYSREAAQFFAEHPIRPSQGNITGRAASEGRAIHIVDVLADPEYDNTGYQGAGGFRTVLGVPLLRQGTTIGVFVLVRTEVNPFTEKQIELVTTFADQAVIAIENARLLSELRESLQQQTATADVLKVISRSTFDLQTVLDTLTASAARLCDADFAFIFQRFGDLLHHAASHGFSSDFIEYQKQNPIPLGRGSLTGRTALEGKMVHIPDVLEDPEYTWTKSIELAQYRTMLGIPLSREGVPIGVIALSRRTVRPFTDRQIELMTTFADQAVIAIENVRLFEAEQQRTRELTESLEQQTATSKVLDVISRSVFDLHAVFETVAESSVRLCGADRAFIYRFDNELLRMVVAYNTPRKFKEFVEQNPLRPSRHSCAARTALERRTIHIPDVLADPEYTFGAKAFGKIRTVLGVPILKDDDLLGVIVIYHQEVRPFTAKQIALVETFADQAAIAIENVRLLDTLRQRTDELGRSVGELRALGEVSQAVNSTLDLETVLSTIVAKAVQLSGTEAGAIYVFDNRQRQFHLRATYGMDRELIDALTHADIGVNEPNIALILAERELIQVADLKEEAPSDLNKITLRAGYRARLVAPLIRGEDVVGLLVVRRKTPGAFPPNTVDLIKTFAAQSAVAIENAHLFHNVEASLQDLRTAQDRLIQTEKLASLGQLTAGIAHEIKNPLNFVNNFSAVSVELIDELREALAGAHLDNKLRVEISEIAETLQGNLDKVVQHGKRADAIVKNMLLHSRQGSGEHRPVDINALVDESLNLAYHGARAEKQGFNITLERSFDPTAGEVDLFPQEITRVLLNLISNGFYAATKRKAQSIRDDYEPMLAAKTKNLGDRVEIRIRDNGTGIPPEVKEKLFNPFFTTKPAGEGTGLGLSISHDIVVKQHSGSIEVDTQPGEFTEFRIVLPRAGASLMKSGERV